VLPGSVAGRTLEAHVVRLQGVEAERDGPGGGARRLDGLDSPVRSEPAADNGATRPTGAERKDESG
jgi:hypothetical protein